MSAGRAVESMEEARLKLLQRWIEAKIPFDQAREAGVLSAAEVAQFDDFTRVIELARAGLLADGKRLARIEYRLSAEAQRIRLILAEQQLHCPEMTVTSTTNRKWK